MKVYVVTQWDPYDAASCDVVSVWKDEAKAKAEVKRLHKLWPGASFDYSEMEVRE